VRVSDEGTRDEGREAEGRDTDREGGREEGGREVGRERERERSERKRARERGDLDPDLDCTEHTEADLNFAFQDFVLLEDGFVAFKNDITLNQAAAPTASVQPIGTPISLLCKWAWTFVCACCVQTVR
jgi:hypothetical protein